MTPGEVGKAVDQAAGRALPTGCDRAAMDRAKAAILPDLRPVRPLAPAWVFTLGLVLLFAVFAAASGFALGVHGLAALNASQRAVIFPALLAVAWLASTSCVREMCPASGARLGTVAWMVPAVVFPIVFALLFDGYGAANFVKEGIPCLVAGVCVAVPTGLAIALVLRRGYVLDWSAAGIAAGALAGLAGLGMLEMHCPNLKAIHVMVWHVAVVVSSGILGFGIGRIWDTIRSK